MCIRDSTYTKDELIKWEERIIKILGEDTLLSYSCELKFDGASINLKYQEGELVKALTRGDGLQGDEITANIKTIKTIPLRLKGEYPKFFEARGEIILPIEEIPATQHVRGSNFCHIGVISDHNKNRSVFISFLDKFIKGSAGQAIQNANIMFDFDETSGLLESPIFP